MAETLPLFDTHAHLISDDWEAYPPRPFRPDLPIPDRPDFSVTIDALIQMMDEQHVKQACLVQRGHVYGHDNSYIIDSAQRFPDRVRPIVILDTQKPETADQYRDMVKNQKVGGLRMAQARQHLLDTGWLCSPEAMNVWKACADLGTPMTLILFTKQLPYLLPLVGILARQFPDLPILLDHGAMPFGMTQYEVKLAQDANEPIIMPRAPNFGIDTSIAIFEDVPNIYFKITEINMERLESAQVRPAHLVRRMVDSFGPERVLWGSDVGQSMKWSYAQKAQMARAATDFLTESEARNFLHDNAAALFSHQ
jgi:L-fuconolactonase